MSHARLHTKVAPGQSLTARCGSYIRGEAPDLTGIPIIVPDPPDPRIIITGSLLPFTTDEGTPSQAQNYSLQGIDLTEYIIVEAPAGFEISADAQDWRDVITLPPDFDAPVYVRLTGHYAGTYSGNITHSSSGAQSQHLAASGEVAQIVPAISITARDSNGAEIPPIRFGNHDYWIFTQDSGTLEVQGSPLVDILVVGGGGAGGRCNSRTRGAGGGGAGGVLYQPNITLTEPEYNITRGAGGAVDTSQGGNSSFGISVEPPEEYVPLFEALGGGRGGSGSLNKTSSTGESGGSGGGSGACGIAVNEDSMGGLGIDGQGNRGGNNVPGMEDGGIGGAGGGGGKTPGKDMDERDNEGAGSNGGAGFTLDELFYDDDGDSLTNELIEKGMLPADYPGVGGGGGGGARASTVSYPNWTAGLAENGGGAGGGYIVIGGEGVAGDAQSGQNLTGGGGGGVHGSALRVPGAGGSGIVIIRMACAI